MISSVIPELIGFGILLLILLIGQISSSAAAARHSGSATSAAIFPETAPDLRDQPALPDVDPIADHL